MHGVMEIIAELMCVDWELLFCNLYANVCYEMLVDIIWELVPRFIPKLKKLLRNKNFWPPRAISKSRSVCWGEFKRLRAQFGRTDERVIEAFELFRQSNFRYKRYARDRQFYYEMKLANMLSDAPKSFHTYLRR